MNARFIAFNACMRSSVGFRCSLWSVRPDEARSLRAVYGQVCAQIFPHPRAFDGMLARAPGSLPMLDSDLYVSLQHLNKNLHRIYTIYTYTIAIRSPKSKLKMSSLRHLKSRDIAAQRTIISLIRKRGLDARVTANSFIKSYEKNFYRYLIHLWVSYKII